MGLVLLNISVDSTDLKPQHIPENLTLNDQESIVELVLEKLLGYENAITEFDENDSEENTTSKNVKIDLFLIKNGIKNHNPFYISNQDLIILHPVNDITNGFIQLDVPPPKV